MKIGSIEILQVLDGQWASPAPPNLPKMSPEELAPHRGYLRDNGMMVADVGGFLIRSSGRVILVDAGIGPSLDDHGQINCPPTEYKPLASPDARRMCMELFRQRGLTEDQIDYQIYWLENTCITYGKLGRDLTRVGVDPADITDVILSHLHPDHMGWVSRNGKSFFPKATLWAHQADMDAFMVANGPDETIHKIMMGVAPTRERMAPVVKQIRTWERDCTIAPGIDVRWLPGHTPGSSITIVSSGSARALLLGDVVHCPLELVENEFAVMGDMDPVLAKKSKDILRRELEGTDVHISSPHFPGLHFGRLLRGEGRRYWSWAGA